MAKEGEELIAEAKEFFEYYKQEIGECIKEGKKAVQVSFQDLASFSHELAEQLLAKPEESLALLSLALEEAGMIKNARIRLTELPQSQQLRIREIRAQHLGQLISVEGIVRQASEVRPQVVNAKFECPSCGSTISVLQIDKKFREPSRCACGRRAGFKLIAKEMLDTQRLIIEESPEMLKGGEQPRRISVFLKEDLVEPKMEEKTTPGSRLRVIGILKEVPIPLRTGAISTHFDLALEANNVIPLEESFEELKVTPEEEQAIKQLAADPEIYKKLAQSIAPSIYGYEEIKLAIALQLLGGVRKRRSDGTYSRGDIHVLLVGDPGVAKSVMLRFVAAIAPKGRYIVGKAATGAGITATVVRDEFLRGWALEAGAMVLAHKGIACLDELEKMSDEDRSAMHEAMEQQSYHPDTEIMLADGKIVRIGTLVDELIEANKELVLKGKDCEILPISSLKVLTTDFNQIYPTKIARVSRHKAPPYMVRIEYSNGRAITVTPEHPVFVWDNGFKEVRADKLRPGLLCPAPSSYPLEKPFSLNKLNEPLAKLLGYLLTEGYFYRNIKTRQAEFGVCNTDKELIKEIERLFFELNLPFNKHVRKAGKQGKKELITIRCLKKACYDFFEANFPELLKKAPAKRIPNLIKTAPSELQKAFLRAAFKGDGFVDQERFGFASASYGCAKDYQDLLLQLGIWSYIARESRKGKSYYKVVVSGTSAMERFAQLIVDPCDKRARKIEALCLRSAKKRNYRDPIPNELVRELNELLKAFRLSDGYFFQALKKGQNVNRETFMCYLTKIQARLEELESNLNLNVKGKELRKSAALSAKLLASRLGLAPSTLRYIELHNPHHPKSKLVAAETEKAARAKLQAAKARLAKLTQFVESGIRLVRIKKVTKVRANSEWVYDVTVEPTRTFISEGLVLHNTVTIAKANVQAQLRSETAVLAAANPKFGRFDPYQPVAQQINIPPTLINRFDLIFVMKDIPEKTRDEAIASHVLLEHRKAARPAPIPPELLRKYIAYARQHIQPELTAQAIEEIKRFYVELRSAPVVAEELVRPIPISARQLEALIRLSEASARARLSKKVTRADAKRAIEIMHFYLLQVGIDKETGAIDIDKISTGVPASERSKIALTQEAILRLEARLGKLIPISELKAELAEKLSEQELEQILQKLKQTGDIFEPKRGFIQKI